MAHYTFLKHRLGGGLPVLELAEFECEADARGHAGKLLAAGPQYGVVEVSDDSGRTFMVDRGGVPPVAND